LTHKIHLDTDIGGDIDDLCALALLLRWPEPVQLTGVTSVGDMNGRRAGYARYVLDREGLQDVPVAAGADISGGYYPYELGLPPEALYWPEAVPPLPTGSDAALELLKNSIEQGASIVAIGPYTNLYLLDCKYPGILGQATVVLMGGFVEPPRPGYPDWKNEFDFNIQVDMRSAGHVLRNSSATLVTLPVTAETALPRSFLPALHGGDWLARLIARQSEQFALDEQMEEKYGKTCPALPADIINFMYDPLACAVALGWEGVEVQDIPLVIEEVDGWLVERHDSAGKPLRVVTKVDGPGFGRFWLERVLGK
jgi:inosine-uridine nucleoside N-ribohydrolase